MTSAGSRCDPDQVALTAALILATIVNPEENKEVGVYEIAESSLRGDADPADRYPPREPEAEIRIVINGEGTMPRGLTFTPLAKEVLSRHDKIVLRSTMGFQALLYEPNPTSRQQHLSDFVCDVTP